MQWTTLYKVDNDVQSGFLMRNFKRKKDRISDGSVVRCDNGAVSLHKLKASLIFVEEKHQCQEH